jgi:hypothetical protein
LLQFSYERNKRIENGYTDQTDEKKQKRKKKMATFDFKTNNAKNGHSSAMTEIKE